MAKKKKKFAPFCKKTNAFTSRPITPIKEVSTRETYVDDLVAVIKSHFSRQSVGWAVAEATVNLRALLELAGDCEQARTTPQKCGTPAGPNLTDASLLGNRRPHAPAAPLRNHPSGA